ncbi:unnamed protein product [Candidula unifasciata]|uniref:Uncharacterized protein n=1 Tax=Candidula unifasciata TaxID=100452 RepID=A0A8S3YSV6_9EUPU|nr:unnamed protein product [Candidula unifasciata]
MYISLQIHVNVPITIAATNKVKQHHRLHGGEVKTDAEALYVTELVKMYNDKLRNVVLKELLADKELQKKDNPLPRKIKKLIDLKKSLDEFSKVVDCISAVYTARSLDFSSTIDLPTLEDVREVKEKLCRMKRTLKFKELCSLFEKYDSDFKTCSEAILSAILGLSEDYGKWLSEMDIQMRKHHIEKYYIERAIEKAENEKSADWIQSELSGADCLVKCLQDLGFNEETAVTISSNIPDDLIALQKPSFWALRYLDHAFTYHPLLSNCPKYPENADTLDTWFNITLPQNSDEPNEDSTRTHNVRMINISSKKSEGNALVDVFLKEGAKDTKRQFLYHSTDHVGAMSIVRKGIILTNGKTQQDFSSGDGFYLSETFENAKYWSKACQGKQAIIVYTIENHLLNASEQNGWDFTTSDHTKWEEVIRCCRSGYTNNKAMKKALKKVTFIRGPMCKNPPAVSMGARAKGFGEKDSIQFCIRDDDYAENFGYLQNFACVIFY